MGFEHLIEKTLASQSVFKGRLLDVWRDEVALDWIRQGKITDVKTIIALYWTERYQQGEWGES